MPHEVHDEEQEECWEAELYLNLERATDPQLRLDLQSGGTLRMEMRIDFDVWEISERTDKAA